MLSQTSGFLVDRIASHLRHPLFGRMPCDACQTHTSGLEMQEEQNVIGNQVAPSQHLYREEVGASQNVHVPADELFPSSLLTPFRSRRNSIAAQDVADGLVGNAMAEVGESADDPVVPHPAFSLAILTMSASTEGVIGG